MPSAEYFSQAHKARLAQGFVNLAGVVRSRDFRQIIAAGPSAEPFAKALARVCGRLHGFKPRVVNLRQRGDKLGKLPLDEKFEWKAGALLLKNRKRKLKRTPSLLFDEATFTESSLRDNSNALVRLGIPNETATLVSFEPFSRNRDKPITRHVGIQDWDSSLYGKISIHKTQRLGDAKRRGIKDFLSFFNSLKTELDEVVELACRTGDK